MKLWEFQSAFRWSGVSLESLLHSEKWMSPFGEYFDRFGELVRTQNRDILDSLVPVELSHAASVLCDDLVFSIDETGNIRRREPSKSSRSEYSGAFIHDHFGGAVIEEVLEKGSYRLPQALWLEQSEQGAAGLPLGPISFQPWLNLYSMLIMPSTRPPPSSASA